MSENGSQRTRDAVAAIRSSLNASATRIEELVTELDAGWAELRSLSHSIAGKAALVGQAAAGVTAAELENLLIDHAAWRELRSRALEIAAALDALEQPQMSPVIEQKSYSLLSDSQGTLIAVDDDRALLQLIRSGFEEAGWSMVTAGDHAELERAVELVIPDGIILDVELPHASGFELYSWLRSLPRLHEVPILFLTSRSRPSDVVKGLSFEPEDYIVKPIEIGELVTRVCNRITKVRRLMQAANRDVLTGLPNRRALEEELGLQLSFHRRKQRTISVAMIDLDHFKQINDRFGHAAGDVVLRQIGVRLAAEVRASDRCGRWGGEEFLVILPETDLQSSRAIVERLQRRITGPAVTIDGERSVQAYFSAGVASCVPDSGVWEQLVGAADAACYEAKRRGRNAVVTA